MIHANNSAFPRLDQDYKDVGLNIREYFAAMAMQGLLSNSISMKVEECAKDSVDFADALIAELNKEK